MNKTHRIIFNSALGLFQVASELAKSHGQSSSVGSQLPIRRTVSIFPPISLSKTMLALLACFAVFPTQAITIGAYDPLINDNQVGALIVNNGQTSVLEGNTNFVTGSNGGAVSKTYIQLQNEGYIISGVVRGDEKYISLGSQTGAVSAYDPITNSAVTVQVFNSTSFSEANRAQIAPQAGAVYSGANGNMYIDARLGTVQSTGGLLTVNLGNPSDTQISALSRRIQINAKNTSLVKAEGNGGQNSTVEWTSRNLITMDGYVAPAGGLFNTSLLDNTYGGTFTAFDGSSRTVTNLTELKTYNDWLLTEVAAGRLTQTGYNTAIGQGRLNTSKPLTIQQATSGDTELFMAAGDRAVIHAAGAGAVGRITATGQIDASTSGVTAILLAEEGGLVENWGKAGNLWNSNYTNLAYKMAIIHLRNGGQGLNYGTMAVGYNIGETNALAATGGYGWAGAKLEGGSQFTNKATGVINVRTTNDSQFGAIEVNDADSVANNEGTVNVGLIDRTAGTGFHSGVLLNGGTFNGRADSLIYVGRQAQILSTDAAADIDSRSTLAGIRSVSTVDKTVQLDSGSRIIIGDKTQNAFGVLFQATGATAVLAGTIDVNGGRNGATGESPIINRAIFAQSSAGSNKALLHSGTINLNGLNGIGIQTLTNARITNTGTVNVNGGADPTSGTRNFAMWAENTGSRIDHNTGGGVNLSGDGAIGLHARGGGKIVVGGGDLHFVTGQKQFGFFAYGTGSSIDITAAPAGGLVVDSIGSTLFRVEDGARINNLANAPLSATAAGSTAIQATGIGTVAALDGLDITVTGTGASAVRVEGGATGSMSGMAALHLNDGATAVVIDNQKYGLDGAVIPVATALSKFTNTANVTVTNASNVTAFQVKNGAELTNSGNLDISHGTGIEVSGIGSSIKAGAMAGAITVRDGKAGIYVHGGATLATSDTITVNGSAAGIWVGADSGAVTINPTAHITALGASYGNLIINQATAGTTLVNGAILEMAGSGAALLTSNNLNSASFGTVLVSSNTGGKGIALANVDGSTSSGDLTLGTNWAISVTGNGSGVYANTTGNLTVNSSNISLTGSGNAIKTDTVNTLTIGSNANIATMNAAAVLITGNPSNLLNAGHITAANIAATAILLDANAQTFTNQTGGVISGIVNLGGGADLAQLENGSSLSTLQMGLGADTVSLKNGAIFTLIDGGIEAGVNDTLLFDATTYNLDASSPAKMINFEWANVINNSALTLAATNSLQVNTVNIRDTSRVIVNAQNALPATSEFNVAQNATLTIAPTTLGTFTFGNVLTGSGIVGVNLHSGTDAFNFAGSTGNAFTGKVVLGTGQYALSGANTSTLTNATLVSATGNKTTVGTGTQSIGGLAFNGGTVAFNAQIPSNQAPTGTIQVANLDASGVGKIQVDVAGAYDVTLPQINSALTLMEQDDVNVGVKLLTANTSIGSGGALTLVDQNVVAISAAQNINVLQNGTAVAIGAYDYRLTTAPNDGIYVNYGLKTLNLQAGETLTLAPKTGVALAARDLSAELLGSGNLAVAAGLGTVSLSNTLNSFTGTTTVQSGTLGTEATNVFARSNAIIVAAGATLSLGQFSQSANDLQGAGNIHLGTATLTAVNADNSHNTSFTGLISGTGNLSKSGTGSFSLSADQTFTGLTTVNAGTLVLGVGGTTGSLAGNLAIEANGLTQFNRSNNQTYAGMISGTGAIEKLGASTLTLTGTSSFTGRMTVAAGSVQIGDGATSGSFAGNIVNNTKVIFDRSDASDYVGVLSGAGDFIKQGMGALTLSGVGSTQGSVSVNSGTLKFMHNDGTYNPAGNPFTVTGDYLTKAGATTSIGHQNSTLAVGGTYTHEADSDLNILLGASPDIIANKAVLAGRLNFEGFNMGDNPVKASTVMNGARYEMIRTTAGVEGAFQEINSVDYLISYGFVSADTKSYLLGFGLSWKEGGQVDGTGSFTLAKGSVFDVDVALDDQAMPMNGFNSGWNGQDLTKNGEGELILSTNNGYTGSTTINGGTLYLAGEGSISNSSNVTLTSADSRLNLALLSVNSSTSNEIASLNNLSGVTGSSINLDNKSLRVNNTQDTVFSGDFEGTPGNLIKAGAANLTLSGKTLYTGDTLINEGSLTLDGSNYGAQLTSNVIGEKGTTLNLINGATLTGFIDPTDVNIDRRSTWNMTGDSVVNHLNHSGTINFAEPENNTFKTLIVEGDFIGNHGLMTMNTQLGGDLSATDRLIIQGDSSGTTLVQVMNAGGSGAQTIDGIEIIRVAGESSGEFKQVGRIVAGAYDYALGRSQKNGKNWVLSSELTDQPTVITPTVPTPTPVRKVRPEGGAYLGNALAASSMFMIDVQDRQHADNSTSLWSYGKVGQRRLTDSSNQIKTSGNHSVGMLGGDLSIGTGGDSNLRVGVMMGYGHDSSTSRSIVTAYQAKGTVSGYTTGLYANWQQNEAEKTGVYIDTWLQYNWFTNKIQGDLIHSEKYRSRGLSASLESGYTFKVASNESVAYFIQPKAQIIWQGLNTKNYRESNGTHITFDDNNNLQTRLGVRASTIRQNADKSKQIGIFAELNWLHNSENSGIKMDGVKVTQKRPRDIAELKLGIDGQLSKNLTISGSVGLQKGSNKYHDTAVTLGINYRF